MRPMPPQAMTENPGDMFEPGDDLREWMFETFIADDGELTNPDHAHLANAEIGVLWTNVGNAKNMRMVLGQAELMPPMAMGKWQRARAIRQIEEWFGSLPDFVLTFFAPAAVTMDDASFCALVEHELYHCAQARDIYGMPKFTKEGRPSFAIRGHDVEEFIGVVARYGSAAAGVSEMVEAANRKPLVALADITGVCGTCALKAA